MRLNKCKGIIFGLCLCVSVFGTSCGNQPEGMENNPVAEPVINPESMEKTPAGASLKIAEIMALPSYSIVDVAGFATICLWNMVLSGAGIGPA